MSDLNHDVRIDWNGDGDYSDTGEDVSADALDTGGLTVQYGRDQNRSQSPMAPGQMAFELNNASRDYSPANTSSPLSPNVLPARALRYQITHDSVTYTIFRGHTDNYDVQSLSKLVSLTALDALADLRGTEVSTELHHGIRTGAAVGLILDAIGWPAADRDLDSGATIIPWWWLDRTDAYQAMEDVLASEGLPALLTVDANGKVIFRDRHHRLTESASLTSQATFRDATTEPILSGLTYDQGWRDIVNSVTLSVDERRPAGVAEAVWSSDQIYSVTDGETVTVRTQPSDPVLDAITPVEDVDYRVRSGTVSIALSQTSGTAISILITGVGGPAEIDQLQLRAYPVSVRRTVQIHVEDSASDDAYGMRAPGLDAPWVGVHDALSIAEITLAHRAEPLPIVRMLLDGGDNDTVLAEQLGRDLSDRVTVIETETAINDDFFLERIEHTVSDGGGRLATVFGLEQAPTQIDSAFTFDVAGRGFDDGKFGKTGLSDPDNIFRFDVAGQGFDDGLFAY